MHVFTCQDACESDIVKSISTFQGDWFSKKVFVFLVKTQKTLFFWKKTKNNKKTMETEGPFQTQRPPAWAVAPSLAPGIFWNKKPLPWPIPKHQNPKNQPKNIPKLPNCFFPLCFPLPTAFRLRFPLSQIPDGYYAIIEEVDIKKWAPSSGQD